MNGLLHLYVDHIEKNERKKNNEITAHLFLESFQKQVGRLPKLTTSFLSFPFIFLSLL